jgi:hypothetical protein
MKVLTSQQILFNTFTFCGTRKAFLSENMKETDYRLRWEDNTAMDLREVGVKVWTGGIWFRKGTSGWGLM